MRGSPGGVSQSTIADFKLFVSSDLALEAPFCNYQKKNMRFAVMCIFLMQGTYHARDCIDFLYGITVHKPFFKSRYTLQ